MRLGTKSILYGAHQFIVHPIMLLVAWWRLYGVPWDPRLWVAFVVHDIGYLGKPNMDGPEGESHPILGAKIMGFLFGPVWELFTISHSRFYAKRAGIEVSQLCVADKLATVITPGWLYLRLVRATGEIREYRRPPATRYEDGYTIKAQAAESDEEWVDALKSYMGSQVPKLNRVALSYTALKEQYRRGKVKEPCIVEDSAGQN